MKEVNKIRLGWIAFCFVSFHFVCIFIYALPEGVIPNGLKSFSYGYVSPVFEQKWALFVPCPIVNQNLEIKYFFDDDSTDWVDVNADAKKKHSFWRLTYHGDIALGESNLLYWVAGDFEIMNISLYQDIPIDSASSFKNYYSYYLVKNYAMSNAISLYDKKPDSAYVKCNFHNVKTDERGSSILPKFSWID